MKPSLALRLTALSAVLAAALAPLTAAPTSPADAASGTPAPVTKAQLLTLAEVEAVFPQLRGRHDDGVQSRFRFGFDAPSYWSAPLRCDHTRLYRGTSRVTADSSTLSGPDFGFLESIVRFRTTHQARSVLQHYRNYALVCAGRHASDDGDGGKATLEIRTWRPAPVGDDRFGLLDGFTTRYGGTEWRRSVVTRVGRTVVFTVSDTFGDTGDPAQADAGARAAVAKLG